MRIGVCPGVGLQGWLRWFAHHLSGGVCRERVQDPAFAPGPFRSGSWAFLVFLYLFGSEFAPTVHACYF